MRLIVVALAALFGIPLLTLGWLYITDGKLIFVHNPGGTAKEISAVAYDGSYIERRDPIILGANGFTWMFFTPRVKGGLTVLCKQGDGFSTFPLGKPGMPARMISDVTVDGCDHRGVYKHA